MVELRLDSVDDASMPMDCFISVRVGDVQKLSRLSSTRAYRFPQASDRRYGKIEVFRRIGVCSVDIDPVNENLRDVSISCQEAGFGSLGLKIAVEADEGTQKKNEGTDQSFASKKSGKVKEAKEYLNKHRLELTLSEAMQAVLKERPEDPTTFLASKLLAHAKSGKLPPVEPSSPQPKKPEPLGSAPAAKPAPPAAKETPHNTLVVPFTPFYKANFKQIKDQGFQTIYDKFPMSKVPQSKLAAKQTPCVTSVVPFASFYKVNFKQIKDLGFQSIYDKFPKSKNPQSKMAAKETPCITSVIPFASFYKVNFKQINDGGFQSIYDKFPKSKILLSKQSSQKSAEASLYHKPSVGTWINRLPKYLNGVMVNSSPATAMKNTPAAPAHATRLEQVGGPTKDWALKPSAGTWVARPVKINQAAIQKSKKEWVLKPSVGTWLSPRFVEEEVEEEQSRAMVLTTQVMMGPSFYGMGLRPMTTFI